MFFKIGVFKNFATVKHVFESLINKVKERRSSKTGEHCKTFKNSFLYRISPMAAFVSLIK